MNTTLNILSPYDLSIVGSVAYTPASQIDSLLDAASSAKQNTLPKTKRIEILETLITSISQNQEDIALTIAREGGKPLSDAFVEAQRAAEGVRNAIDTLSNLSGNEVPMGHTPSSANRLAFTTREPIGTVVAISAFNHPFNLIIHQVIPAIAVGCPVIVKPSLKTPLSCINLVDMLYQAGLPKEYCQVAILEDTATETLATDPRVDFLTFIGSAKVGWHLRSKIAPGTRCALEHGGVAPVIVDQDADLEKVIPSLLKGAFYHAGQVCVSVQRVFIHNAIKDEFTQRLTQATSALKTGDPSSPKTEVGPLIHPNEVTRISNWIDQAVAEGAQLLCGGRALSETCYAPTLLLDPAPNSLVSTHEIFGPVCCLYGFDSLDKAIAQSNALPFAFQASIFSQNIDKALYGAKKLSASAVMVNDHTAFRVDWMPFSGQNKSGLGTGGIPHTMHDMTQEKLIVFNSPSL